MYAFMDLNCYINPTLSLASPPNYTSAARKGCSSDMLFPSSNQIQNQFQRQKTHTFCLDLVQNSLVIYCTITHLEGMQQEDYRITNRFVYCIYWLTISEYTFVLCTLIALVCCSSVVLDKPVISSFRILVSLLKNKKKTKTNNSGTHNYCRCYADQWTNSAFTSGAEPGVLFWEMSFKLNGNTSKSLTHTHTHQHPAGSLQPSTPIPWWAW